MEDRPLRDLSNIQDQLHADWTVRLPSNGGAVSTNTANVAPRQVKTRLAPVVTGPVDLLDKRRACHLLERICSEVTGKQMTLDSTELLALMSEQDKTWAETHDAGIYDGWAYVWRALDSWANWSCKNVQDASKTIEWYKPDFDGTFVDVGAGIGATTAQLLQRFPRSRAVYTNLPSMQVEVASILFDELGLTDRVEISVTEPVSGEVVLALELLEHIYDPINFITPYLSEANLFVDGSSFTARSCGHYPVFAGGVHQDDMRGVLGKSLRRQGFVKAVNLGAPKMWNNRPNIWRRP